MLAGKRILLIIGGGIAAYKSLELIRRLRDQGAEVVPVLTEAAKQFVTPLSVAALSGNPVHQDLFDLTTEAEMGHIQLSRSADLVVVAPCTANLMAKMAGGHADDLPSTLLMATDKRVLIAPAMNVRMWTHPATQRNLVTLEGDGVLTCGPDDGSMACGEFGPGRMAEPAMILQAIDRALGGGKLAGKRILVTSGPTHEPIDPVRYIANRSSGAQGTALAAALRDLGAHVVFVTGPADVPPPQGVEVVKVQTAREMLEAVQAALPADAAVMAAAVADWRVVNAAGSKMKKDGSGKAPGLEFAENPDILATVSKSGDKRPGLVVGFAAETDTVVEYATAKRLRKGCDWIVANDVSPATGIMGGTSNAVTIITDQGAEAWPMMAKEEVARRLAARIAAALSEPRVKG
ncbi:bifunctional phosphopantothenoylcysteine decarboxylase/phosphopantothenate--cysteine ligase CoaBC [Falsigemmobacter faecalis]|uniref:Coenzyme A biosynthesis bifunctional protein CoaBC n=1 Tax=Falsigemmobacter faecalis TaxID=2488730 RepID=A0A3P3DQW2_9RHOB|nr:bifunctional phosphopantothenoylcysteine decarboxylase/phosphopantothenate--cysteine ligase CoaBC [Falsigemmobacter faecalis]RRH76650.1 bifunctional phosphopantothenoylcysteine decarboxylase/phosphopantothenate--cysteine ligase CoaBC [Falsigemmobacter faecalis]